MGILPGIWLLGTVDHTLKQMTTTEFCIQCHTMEGYGKSLHAEDAESSLAAAHFQNNRVPRHEACYECHADHRPVIGLIKTKLNGLREAYIEYLGTPHEPLKMSKPYENTNCLRCHGKARNFRETHEDDLETILAGKTRCLECHDVGHDLGGDKDE
jgi:nitrate/TMAO reductase-like tetraheme cytochrome c subunit